jgi:hypothetical protein
MPPTSFFDIVGLPLAILLWWGLAESLFSGIERRQDRHLGVRERLMIGYLWPLFFLTGLVVLLLRSRHNL